MATNVQFTGAIGLDNNLHVGVAAQPSTTRRVSPENQQSPTGKTAMHSLSRDSTSPETGVRLYSTTCTKTFGNWLTVKCFMAWIRQPVLYRGYIGFNIHAALGYHNAHGIAAIIYA